VSTRLVPCFLFFLKKMSIYSLVFGLWVENVMDRTKMTARKSNGPPEPNYGPRKSSKDINCDSSEDETDRPLAPDMDNELEKFLREGGNVKEYISGRKVVFIVGGKRGKPISIDSRKGFRKGVDVREYLEGRKVVFIVGGKRGNPIRVVY
jgi:hypothetical protein